MPRRPGGPLLALDLDSAAAEPMHRQAYEQVRALVLSSALPPGTRLPSTRQLARELGVSRNTLAAAYDQLTAEGYLEGRAGSGSFVPRALPDARPVGRSRPGGPVAAPASPSARGARMVAAMPGRQPRRPAFSPGLPALDEFPFDWWGRQLARVWRRPPADLSAGADPAGWPPLRRAVAQYLVAVRALRCMPGQVIVTAGAQQAIGLAARVLLDEGGEAAIEEPCFPGLRGALAGAGVAARPVPVDGEGLMVDRLAALAPRARLACVTPSRHFPLGMRMGLARRLALLDWARRADAWVLEDDYDSEYRYAGRPIAALQGLDPDGRVIYVGSFSKVLFPTLRLAYLVVPEGLAEAFRRARAALDDHAPTLAQPVLAEFMESGRFAGHVRRMRRLYEARQQALLEALARHAAGLVEAAPEEAGMHLVARLAPGLDDAEASARLAAAGMSAPAVSAYYGGEPAQRGLLLGYAAVPEERMAGEVGRLAAALLSPGSSGCRPGP